MPFFYMLTVNRKNVNQHLVSSQDKGQCFLFFLFSSNSAQYDTRRASHWCCLQTVETMWSALSDVVVLVLFLQLRRAIHCHTIRRVVNHMTYSGGAALFQTS